MELLKFARKMLLCNAEKRLSEMITKSAKSARSPDELMSFLSGTPETNIIYENLIY